MEITTELLKTLYDRTHQYCIAKYGSQPDTIRIEDDGSLCVIYDGYERGDEEYHYFSPEELTSDLDALATERIEKEKQEKIKQEAYQKEQQIIRDENEKQRRKSEYLKLKKEFGD